MRYLTTLKFNVVRVRATLIFIISCASTMSQGLAAPNYDSSFQAVQSSTSTDVANNNQKDDDAKQLIGIIRTKIADHELQNTSHSDDRGFVGDEISALAKTGSSLAIPILDELVTTYPSVVVKQNAVAALGALVDKDDAAIAPIEKGLKDNNVMVRLKAADILARTSHRNDAIPTLIEIASINDLEAMDKDILEDEFYRPEFIMLSLIQHGKREEAIKQNPNITTLSDDDLKDWAYRFKKLKEYIIDKAINDLAIFPTADVEKVLSGIASTGPSERIKATAHSALEHTKTSNGN